MTRGSAGVTLGQFGSSPQAAVRLLLAMFQDRGWRDESGAAVQLVETLRDAPGAMSADQWIRHVPSAFLLTNGIQRRDLVIYLTGARENLHP